MCLDLYGHDIRRSFPSIRYSLVLSDWVKLYLNRLRRNFFPKLTLVGS